MKYLIVLVSCTAVLLMLVLTPQPASAHDDPCIWNGSKDSRWGNKENWDQCDGGIPQAHDDVQLADAPHTPNIDSLGDNVVVHNVDLNGTQLWIDVSRSLNAQGTFTAQGATIHNNGIISGTVHIGPGTTIARGNFDGPVTILPAAKLEVVPNGALTFNNDLNINALGELSTLQGGSASFTGTTFTNSGKVNALVLFSRAGAQTMAGTGEWTPFSEVRVGHESTTSLANSLTLHSHKLLVSSHGTLSVGAHTLVISGTSQLALTGATVAGSGKLDAQGNVTIANSTVFSPTLDVTQGRVTANGSLNGPIAVSKGATLTVLGGGVLNATNNITLKGALDGSTFLFGGASFKNDGQVLGPLVRFVGSSQTLQGSGSFSATNTTTINHADTVTLGSDHQMGKVTIYSNGTLNISNRTLSLQGAGTPLLNQGAFQTAGSTVVYNGAVSQTVATANIDYFNLTINNKKDVNLPAAETVPGTLTLKEGAFKIGGNLTMGNGATIARENGNLNGTPNFGAEVNVEYNGLLGVTTGTEIPTAKTVLKNLKVNRGGGDVTLGSDATMHGKLDLAFGDLKTDTFTLTMTKSATSKGDGDVVGKTQRTGPFALSAPYSFGNRFVTLMFTAGTPPNSVTVRLQKDAPSDFTTAVKRKYTVTPQGGSGYAATWRMHYQDGELNNNAENALQLFRYDATAHQWKLQPRTAMSTSENWVERGGVTAFSPWTLAASNCTAKPAKPQLVSPGDGASLAQSRVTLKWNAATCADTYKVIVRRDSTSGELADRKGGLTGTSYKTDELARGHTYFWKVIARNSFGKRASDWRHFTLP